MLCVTMARKNNLCLLFCIVLFALNFDFWAEVDHCFYLTTWPKFSLFGDRWTLSLWTLVVHNSIYMTIICLSPLLISLYILSGFLFLCFYQILVYDKLTYYLFLVTMMEILLIFSISSFSFLFIAVVYYQLSSSFEGVWRLYKAKSKSGMSSTW